MPLYRANYTAAERKLFGQRLNRLMTERGWSGAELARRASLHLPAGKKPIGRDTIAWYVRGKRAPGPVFLKAVARALDIAPEMLLPRSHQQAPGEAAPVPVLEAPDQKQREDIVRMVINPNIPLETAWEMAEIYMKAVRGKKS